MAQKKSALKLTKRQKTWGYFISGGVIGAEPEVKLLKDGRNIKLLKEFVYVNPKRRRWTAPEGSIVNGSDIPEWMWSLGVSPLVGLHRYASILHDVYCVIRTRRSQEVHDMYYDACRAAGMSRRRALAFWKAVDVGGPRWKRDKTDARPKVRSDEGNEDTNFK